MWKDIATAAIAATATCSDNDKFVAIQIQFPVWLI